MADNESIVLEFFDRMGDLPRWIETIEEYATPDVTFEASGFPSYQSTDYGRALMEQWNQMMADRGIVAVDIEMKNTAAKGDIVFVERLDRFLDAEGNMVVGMAINSVIYLRDGKITLARDYFDPREWLH